MIIELSHPTDPRYLAMAEPPERVSVSDLGEWRYGKPLIFAPEQPALVYDQPNGPGTDWVHPNAR